MILDEKVSMSFVDWLVKVIMPWLNMGLVEERSIVEEDKI
jgi:hypothetical protein